MALLALAIPLSTTATTVTVIGTIQNATGTGVITIGTEDISYTGNSGNQFLNCVRGANSTTPAVHQVGAPVTYTQNPVVTIPITQSGVTPIASYPWTTITQGENIVELQDYAAPTNAVTGKDIAPIGSRFTNITAGTLYLNTGTQASPVWSIVEAGTDQGITQLTGGVTAGPGNGSQAATVVSVGGVSAANVATAVTTANNALPKAGGTMTGTITLAPVLNPTIALNGTTANSSIFVDKTDSDTLVVRVNAVNALSFFVGGQNLLINSYILTSNRNISTNSSMCAGTNTVPDCAILSATSTTKGVLFPNMTTTQRDAIVAPTSGLVIYNTTTGKLNVYTTVWEAVTSA